MVLESERLCEQKSARKDLAQTACYYKHFLNRKAWKVPILFTAVVFLKKTRLFVSELSLGVWKRTVTTRGIFFVFVGALQRHEVLLVEQRQHRLPTTLAAQEEAADFPGAATSLSS